MSADREITIFTRLLEGENKALTPEVARYLLEVDFSQEDRDRMRVLSEKARAGTLTRAERDEINSYEVVGHLVSILQSRARQALKRTRKGA
jgi:hypothetical protein